MGLTIAKPIPLSEYSKNISPKLEAKPEPRHEKLMAISPTRSRSL
jgi:hypothetical protein